MKLLIRLYLKDINPYNITQILETLKLAIENHNESKIQLMTNDDTFDFVGFDYIYLSETDTPKVFNYKINDVDWDIIIPINNTIIANKNFDTIIKNIYTQKFENLNGVLYLKDNKGNIIRVIGRKYFEQFNYIYNPIYSSKYFDDEFDSIIKTNEKTISDDNIFKYINIVPDDEKIFEFRKKLNFIR